MTDASEQPKCAICGEPMPPGEEMFKYHGYSSCLCIEPTRRGWRTKYQGYQGIGQLHKTMQKRLSERSKP